MLILERICAMFAICVCCIVSIAQDVSTFRYMRFIVHYSVIYRKALYQRLNLLFLCFSIKSLTFQRFPAFSVNISVIMNSYANIFCVLKNTQKVLSFFQRVVLICFV